MGLEYLTLSRASATLSGGESQRIRLATQIGSSLVGVLYILDEPSIGLHQRDNDKLLATLQRLRDIGNTLIVVEHDEDTMRAADYIVDVGPGAGVHGGQIVCAGTAQGDQGLQGLHYRPVPLRGPEGAGALLPAARKRGLPHHPQGPGEQPEKHRCENPPGDLHLRFRRVRVGEILPGQRDSL